MKPARRWWLLFGAGVAALAAVLAFVSVVLLDLEAGQQRAQDYAAHQERLRLALWRMDSWLAPRLAREAARPYFEYTAYASRQQAYTRMLQPIDGSEVLTASPLLTLSSDIFPLHFQLDGDGVWSSPQVPRGSQRQLALNTCIGPEAANARDELLAVLAGRVPASELRAALQIQARLQEPDADDVNDQPQVGPPASSAQNASVDAERTEDRQVYLNQLELGKRSQTLKLAQAPNPAPDEALARDMLPSLDDSFSAAGPEPELSVGPLQPLWLVPGQVLVYARSVQLGDTELVQGLSVHWPLLRDTLLAEVHDLLPHAQLLATAPQPPHGSSFASGLTLASVPAELLAPAPVTAGLEGPTPARLTLALVWAVAALAVGAAAHTLRSSLELGERRSRFASAVTHELRTPLTTFRMYAEMLADDMVTDPNARRSYLETLRDESLRLSRLVENVLGYARLEEGRAEPTLLDTSVGALLDELLPALARRARDGGLTLSVEADDARATALCCDSTVVGQILFNLVDNAAKYAPARDGAGTLVLAAQLSGDRLLLALSDQGPGVSRADERRIFAPFERRAADAIPGVGLGLALSRGLARHLGGDLTLRRGSSLGACFELSLPLIPSGSRTSEH